MSARCFASQNVGVTHAGERIWLVTFMQYDLGYFDDETCRLEAIENPFGPKVLPICPERTILVWSGRPDLNRRPPAPKAGALPGCATPRLFQAS